MTRTEARLRDALQASAARVQDDRLRPLPAPEPDPAAEGHVRSVDYRVSRAQGLGGTPRQVWLTADPSGQHLLVVYAVAGGFVIGWIGQHAFHPLPITQPYLPDDATLVVAW